MPETSNTPVGGRGAAGMLSEAQRPRHNRAAAPALGAPVITDPAIVAAGERISDLDRAWFKGRPDRAHRVRRMMPNEFPGTMPDGPLAWPVFVIVKARLEQSDGAVLRVGIDLIGFFALKSGRKENVVPRHTADIA